MPHIPQEIIDAILDQFVGCHQSSAIWRTCALVSKSFQPHSQRLLFRSITINAELPSLLRLHAILGDSPHLGTHVRKLTVSVTSEVLETLSDTLTKFTGVTSCIWWHQYGTLTSNEILLTRLHQFLRSPSLVKVWIQGAHPDNPLIRFLASCEQLKSLAVNVRLSYHENGVVFRKFPRAVSISTTRPTSASGLLEALVIHQDSVVALVNSLTSQSSGLRVSHLRKLTLIARLGGSLFEEGVREASQKVLDLCAESLQELTVGKHRHLSLSGLH